MALVVLSVVEQRLDAVRVVLAGADVTEVAASVGVHRSTVHRWVGRYLSEQLAGLVDRSHRPHSSPAQVEDGVEVAVAEMRREHPRWGSHRIRLEMLRGPGPWCRGGLAVPSERTIDRILQRQGLLRSRPRKRSTDSFVRWERPAAMQLWQMDIVGGVRLVDPATGVLREAKLVTAVDDHSRFCVIAKVVERATARAVCLALQLYAKVKQYQLQADRAYGWVFDENGSLEDTSYFSSVAQSESTLDRLVKEMKLQPVGQGLRPSARRPVKRTRKKKRRHR
ncbi:helix-turn-helix domain-containing protein [Actinoplanes sp. NPDC049599]|uniref:helix-turn-helix domain-containing protein n=1 Tax=Actinoplanes sp. NPDC049599 TaxID=3363903 RepID=UPI003793092C